MDNEPKARSYNVLSVVARMFIKCGVLVFFVFLKIAFENLPIGIPLKMLLLYMPMSIAFLILAIQYIVGKTKEIEGKRTLSDLFVGLILLIISIVMSYSVLADTVLQDYETETITVKAVRTPRLRGIIEKEVYSTDRQIYKNPFNEFAIARGKTYEITYLARMKIIIDVEEVKDQSEGGSP